MKKIYVMPSIDTFRLTTENSLAANSPSDTLDSGKDDQVVIPGEDPYDGEFSSNRRGGRTVWDDDFEDAD